MVIVTLIYHANSRTDELRRIQADASERVGTWQQLSRHQIGDEGCIGWIEKRLDDAKWVNHPRAS